MISKEFSKILKIPSKLSKKIFDNFCRVIITITPLATEYLTNEYNEIDIFSNVHSLACNSINLTVLIQHNIHLACFLVQYELEMSGVLCSQCFHFSLILTEVILGLINNFEAAQRKPFVCLC